MMDDKQLIIAEWSKDNRSSIRVTLGKYCGSPIFDIRTYYLGASGERKPAQQGITLGLKHLRPLCDALEKALNTLNSHN